MEILIQVEFERKTTLWSKMEQKQNKRAFNLKALFGAGDGT